MILLSNKHKKKNREEEGFSLVETLVAILLLGLALMALAQLFLMSVVNNSHSSLITNANLLAQQQIDTLRSLGLVELNNLLGNTLTEDLDINGDGINDFQRVTDVNLYQGIGGQFLIRVRVFSELRTFGDPNRPVKSPKADITTVIVHTYTSS